MWLDLEPKRSLTPHAAFCVGGLGSERMEKYWLQSPHRGRPLIVSSIPHAEAAAIDLTFRTRRTREGRVGADVSGELVVRHLRRMWLDLEPKLPLLHPLPSSVPPWPHLLSEPKENSDTDSLRFGRCAGTRVLLWWRCFPRLGRKGYSVRLASQRALGRPQRRARIELGATDDQRTVVSFPSLANTHRRYCSAVARERDPRLLLKCTTEPKGDGAQSTRPIRVSSTPEGEASSANDALRSDRSGARSRRGSMFKFHPSSSLRQFPVEYR